MITGEQFAQELLLINKISADKCLIIKDRSYKASQLLYKSEGTSKIILVDDDSSDEKLAIAAHEVGHFLSNTNNQQRYESAHKQVIILLSSTLLSEFLLTFLTFYVNVIASSLSYLLMIFLCLVIVRRLCTLKINDEVYANDEATDQIKKHSSYIFHKFNDSRSLLTFQRKVNGVYTDFIKLYTYRTPIIYFAIFSIIPVISLIYKFVLFT